MNYQKTASDFARTKIPELSELSFGCLLKNRHAQLDYEALNVFLGKTNKEIRVFRPSFKTYNNFPTETFEVIGHPIQLQHWLRVLAKDIDNSDLPLGEVHIAGISLYVQPDKTKNFFKFNLITGQPATEADWKALCEVLGLV